MARNAMNIRLRIVPPKISLNALKLVVLPAPLNISRLPEPRGLSLAHGSNLELGP
jgi:hypothetical protein